MQFIDIKNAGSADRVPRPSELPTTNSPATSRWWLQLKFPRRREKWNPLGCRLKSPRRENWNASRHGGPNLKLPDVGHFRTLSETRDGVTSSSFLAGEKTGTQNTMLLGDADLESF